MSNTNYIGEKVAYLIDGGHKYAHVAIVDGDKVIIEDSGLLVIVDTGSPRQKWSSALNKTVKYFDTDEPELWNFIYDNKNPDIAVGVHYVGNLPELFPNIEGEKDALG
jgi:hypothetical protein